MDKKLTPDEIADKILALTEQFNQFVFENPEILDKIPEKAALVFLDVDDPAFNEANLALAHSSPLSPECSGHIVIKMKRRVRVIEEVTWEATVAASPSVTAA